MNSGKRRLGKSLGERLAAELDVSLQELGAPLALCGHGVMTLRSRLEELEADVVQLQEENERSQKASADAIQALRTLFRRLEARLESRVERERAES